MKIQRILLAVLLLLITAEIYTMDLSQAFSDDQSSTEIDQTSDTELSLSIHDNLSLQIYIQLHLLMSAETDEKTNSIYENISTLVKENFDVTWRNYSCLIYAIQAGHVVCMRRCIELIPDAERNTIIQACLNSEHLQSVHKLLFALVVKANDQVMELLRSNPFDEDVLSTMLIQLAQDSQNLDVFDEFMRLGANINGPTHHYAHFIPGNNPLYNALFYRNGTMVNAFRKCGALTRDAFQHALRNAILNDDTNLLEFLLNHDCPINLMSEFEINGEFMPMYPIEAACSFSSESFCLRLLDAMPNIEDVADVLDDASMRGFVTFVRAWLSRFGSNEEDDDLIIPLNSAIQLENEKMLRLLAEYTTIPVNLISFACGKKCLAIIPTMMTLSIDTADQHDAYHASLALYENELFDAFEWLVNQVFVTLNCELDQRTIVQRIVRDTKMSVSQRTRLLAYCLANSNIDAEDIKAMIYTAKPNDKPKPVARNLFATDFKELTETKIPYVASLLTHKQWPLYQKDKEAYITQAFARNNRESIMQALKWAAFSLDSVNFEFIINKIALIYPDEKLFNNKLQQAQILRAILYAPSESQKHSNLKVSLFNYVMSLGFDIHEEFLAEAYTYDKSFAATVMIHKIMAQKHGKYIDLVAFSPASSSNVTDSSNNMAVDTV